MEGRMIKKLYMIFILLPIISVFIVSVTPFFIPVNVEDYQEFQEAKFGFPIPFVRQNLYELGAEGYEGGFPHRFGLQMDFLDKNLILTLKIKQGYIFGMKANLAFP